MSESAGKARSLSDEQIINRWGFDYYVFKALSAFRDADYTAFTHFTSIIENLVVRPVDGHSDMIVKLRCMQFLSRINNGDKLDLTFEEPKTPLESALSVLESICRDMSVPQREQQRVTQAIIETLIMVCIRGGEFARAEEVLLTHFSDAADSAGKKKLLLSLIRRRRSSHSVLQLSSYADFKQDMLDFIERLYRVPEPFLLQMLKRSGHPSVRSEPVTSSSQDRQKTSTAAEDHGVVPPAARLSLRSLRQVYGVLRERYAVSVSFTQLQHELEEEEESPEPAGPELHLALSETPLDRESQLPYAGMTISRLVQEDDSQLSDEEEEEEEEEEAQISSPHRIVVPSGPDSDDPEVQTRPSSPPPARHTSPQNHNSETSSAQICTPARHSRRSDTHSSETSSAQICTPTRHSRRSDTRKRNRTVLSSDVESEDHAASPPSSRRSSRHQQQQKSDHSESECVMMEVQCSSAQVSSPARPSSRSPAVKDTHKKHRIVLSSDVESEDHAASPSSSRRSSRHQHQQKSDHSVGESAPDSTPARPSSPASVRRSDRETHKKHRIVLSSDVESEDHAASPSSSRRSSRHKHQQKSDHSVGESAPDSTPARPSSPASVRRSDRDTHKKHRIVLSSDVESEDHAASPSSSRRSSRHKHQQKSDHSVGESAPVSTPARPSSPASVRRSDRDTQDQSSECEMEVEDGGSSVQHSTPARPSSRRSAADTPEQNRSVIVSSESEDHSSSPAAQTHRRRSSSPSSGGAHRRRRARWQDVSGTHENWSDEESLFSATSGRSSKKCSRKMWTVQESEWLKEGVQRFGAGHWEKIRSAFPFTGRTAVNLKDRWRTMLKLRLV
ncbi:telomeric repeat binding factor a isoform X4 [Onychostoma macrolepis]|nr:telomeric repeat binding factor a isoform X3 [Onychostoma macrolepis]XP_058629077.1 telomeric repeat binding factor a isoform X4 [Onychostoma macrolepis]